MDAYAEKLYNTWATIDNKKWERLHRLEDQWKSYLIGVAKKRSPRRKIKDIYKACDIVGEAESLELMKPWMEMFHVFEQRYSNFKKQLEEKLKEVAEKYEIVPYADTMFTIKTSSGGNYHTQGFGANKYAQAKLEEDLVLIRVFGYFAEIVETDRSESDRWGMAYATYELKANITPMDFHMLELRGEFISVLNWATIMWKKSANPRVYFPWLGDEDYNKSLILSRIGTYQITKDNMKLEPSMEEVLKLEEEWKDYLRLRSLAS